MGDSFISQQSTTKDPLNVYVAFSRKVERIFLFFSCLSGGLKDKFLVFFSLQLKGGYSGRSGARSYYSSFYGSTESENFRSATRRKK